MVKIVGIRFKGTCKIYDFGTGDLDVRVGQRVLVDTERGTTLATTAGYVKEIEDSRKELKKVLRIATQEDLEQDRMNKERESHAREVCQRKIREKSLPMKLVGVEYSFDGAKAVFYFTADGRVDFRELVRDLAHEFHTRIEMKQIGVRDAARFLGGMGPCGKELCCNTFLTDFGPVSVKMAKEQGLSLNPAKISGVCGRLMCCLAYEYTGKGGHKHGGGGGCGSGCGHGHGNKGHGNHHDEEADHSEG